MASASSHGGFVVSARSKHPPRHPKNINRNDTSPAIYLEETAKRAYRFVMAFDRSASATYLTAQLARGFSRALQSRAAKLGFSAGQFPILIELWNEEGLTQRQLLDRVDVEQATMANTLARMERDGLIERRPHPQDRRAQLIFLTDKARGLKSEALEAATEADEALFEGFRRFEKELMLEYIRRAIDNARRLDP